MGGGPIPLRREKTRTIFIEKCPSQGGLGRPFPGPAGCDNNKAKRPRLPFLFSKSPSKKRLFCYISY